jgi:hypothetical protein
MRGEPVCKCRDTVGIRVLTFWYHRFTNTNLETQDVLKVPGCPYVFVHEAHPVINLLRMNKHLLGVDIDTTEKMDGQWFKITQPLMESSCETLRTKILSKIETKVNTYTCCV